jgi:GntR family transcriptional regulator/MocR family aminotransferase
MPRRPGGVLLSAIETDPAAARPLYRQLYLQLRKAVLSGDLPPETRLPSTRELARQLGLSRTTVVNTFEQLIADGYLAAREGAGSFVTSRLPAFSFEAGVGSHQSADDPAGALPPLSRRGRRLAATRAGSIPDIPAPFIASVPALDQFPFKTWARLSAKHWRHPPPELLSSGDRAGYRPLREAIAAYLADARGVHCKWQQIIVISGGQPAYSLVAWMVLDPGDAVWVEDPGLPGAGDAFLATGARLVPVPVDEHGLDVAEGIARSKRARLAYVTPSRQHPLGVSMSLGRRLELLEWAHGAGAWVLERDDNSEFRYAGRPLTPIHDLDPSGRVIYMGSFTHSMFSSLRMGYVVVPPSLVDSFCGARSISDWSSPTVTQAVLADFIDEGHFASHLRRMRLVYEARRNALIESVDAELDGGLALSPAEAGIQLIGWLPDGLDDNAVSRAAAVRGVSVVPLSFYYREPPRRRGLFLGFGGTPPDQMRANVRRLAEAIHAVQNHPRD